MVLVGQYDLWVKAGVVSILGAKLHASARLYRVYAPSTHSLPVIKCVSGGINDYTEIELRSFRNGLGRLENISNLYQRIWNCEHTIPKKELKCDGHSSFSAVSTSLSCFHILRGKRRSRGRSFIPLLMTNSGELFGRFTSRKDGASQSTSFLKGEAT